MTDLVAFSVLNSVHTKYGIYGWTGLELYAFKIKMRCFVVLMCRFWNCVHLDKSNINMIMSSLITQPRFSLIPPISLPYGFAFFFSRFFILFGHFPLILLLLLQSFKFIILTILNTKQRLHLIHSFLLWLQF